MANFFYRVRKRRSEKKVSTLKSDRALPPLPWSGNQDHIANQGMYSEPYEHRWYRVLRFLRIQDRGNQRQRNHIPLSSLNHHDSSDIEPAASNSSIYESIADGSVCTKTYGDEEIPVLQYAYEDHVRAGFVPMVTYNSDDVISNNVTQYNGLWEEEIDRLLETPVGTVGSNVINISNDLEPEGILEHTDYQCDLREDLYFAHR